MNVKRSVITSNIKKVLAEMERNIEEANLKSLEEMEIFINDFNDFMLKALSGVQNKIIAIREEPSKKESVEEYFADFAIRYMICKEGLEAVFKIMSSEEMFSKMGEYINDNILEDAYKSVRQVAELRNFCYKHRLHKECRMLDKKYNRYHDMLVEIARELASESVRRIHGDVDGMYMNAYTLLNKKLEVIKKFISNSDDEFVTELKQNLKEHNITIFEEIEGEQKIDIDRNIFNHKELEKKLKDLGFESTRQKGSHKIYTKDSKSIPVPIHNTDMGKGLSIKIQKQSLGLK